MPLDGVGTVSFALSARLATVRGIRYDRSVHTAAALHGEMVGRRNTMGGRRRERVSRLAVAAAFLAVVAPPVAGSSASAYGVYINKATVNRNKTVSLEWTLEHVGVRNLSISVDGMTVKRWPNQNRDTAFRTQSLTGGRHEITVEVLETFWTNTNYGPTDCDISQREGFDWVCEWRWRDSRNVVVPGRQAQAACVVPRVVGLQLKDAEARITAANCSVGTVKRVESAGASGIVLAQQAQPTKSLLARAHVGLVVSSRKTT